MDCPSCGADGVRVLISRCDTNKSRMRRRHCPACDHKFFTVEVVVPDEGVAWAPSPRGMRRLDGFKTVDFF
jgi:transcriptional regulator NrdR family protein